MKEGFSLLFLLLTLLCGIGAAVLRGFQLVSSFDPYTSLIESGDHTTVSLMVLSAVFVIAAFVYAASCRKKAFPAKRLGKSWFAVELAALCVLFAASAVDIYTGFTNGKPSGICLGFLGLFAWGALLMISLNANKLSFTSTTGFWMTIPVFWSCLMLIMEFWGHAGNPVRNTYVYGMLATVFCTLALYAAAGFFFGRAKTVRVLLYALPGLYFAILTPGGVLIAQWLGDPVIPPLSPASMLRFLFIALHLSAVIAAVLYGRFTPPETEPEQEKEAL